MANVPAEPAPIQGISIFARILLSFLSLIILTSTALIVIAYTFSTQSIQEQTKESVSRQLETIKDKFENEFRINLKRSLEQLLYSSALDDYLAASEETRLVIKQKLERSFIRTIEGLHDFEEIMFVDSSGAVNIWILDAKRQSRAVDIKHFEHDANATPAQRKANVLFNRLESIPLLLSSGNMEWFIPPRDIEIEGPFLGKDGALFFWAGIAKLDLDTASFGGVLMVRLGLDHFLDNLAQLTFLNVKPIWVFDQQGKLLQQPTDSANSFDPRPALERLPQGPAKQVLTDRGLVAYQDLAILPGQSFLRVVVSIPDFILTKDIAKALYFFTMVLIGAIIVVLVVSLYVSRYLSKPIAELARTAARLASGDLSARVSGRTTGEVQSLVESFNNMSADLQDLVTTRDAVVASLKKEISERQRAEQRLKERTEEALQAMEAQLAAESADQAKSQFLATMSHEIRTPINGVLGMTELLLNTNLSSEQLRYAENAYYSGQALLSIINDVLDLAKIESGKIELESVSFDLREMVEELGQLFAGSAHNKDLELACSISPELPSMVQGDPVRLRQILTNLIGNALKFTEVGEIVISVCCAQGDMLKFQVADTGAGIEPEAQRHIFDAFSQGDSTTTRKYGGTGLGLAICKQLVDLMGGEIGVDSTLGKGAVFWFTAALPSVPTPAEQVTHFQLSALRVLLIDDNDSSRAALSYQLQALGVSQRSVGDSRQALQALRQASLEAAPFHVALIDQDMPDTNGVALAQSIREDSTIAGTHLVLLTGLSKHSELDPLANTAQVDSIINKPCRSGQLHACLRPIANQLSFQVPAARDPAQDKAPADHLKGNILVVEDNPVNQELAIHMLKILGCTADLALNGAEALKQLANHQYDAILMDCQMPVMDGFEATLEIRRNEKLKGHSRPIPIIALTANVLADDLARCRAVGMNDCLSKPFKLAQLRQILARWLPAHQSSLARIIS